MDNTDQILIIINRAAKFAQLLISNSLCADRSILNLSKPGNLNDTVNEYFAHCHCFPFPRIINISNVEYKVHMLHE